MQEAYASEKNAVAGWGEIGYTAPGTKTDSIHFTTTNFQYIGGGAIWTASNTAKLNDCAAIASPSATSNSWKMEAEIANESAGDGSVVVTRTVAANCGGLTPSFDQIGQTKAATSNEQGGGAGENP